MATVNARVRSVDFLPEIFQTPANKQFLGATLDQLIQEPDMVQTQGYVGRKVGPGVNPQDQYVVEPTKSRNDYQLEPAVTLLDPETHKVADTITYPGIVDAVGVQGGITSRQDRLFESEYYAWDPLVDYDKLVNYSQYFWLPFGPDSVTVAASGVPTSQDYTVTRANGAYRFSGEDGTNPVISLVRSGNYTFTVAQNETADITYRVTNNGTASYNINYAPNPTLTLVRGNTYSFDLSLDRPLPFYIKTEESFGTVNQWTSGVVNNGASTGTITFTVPQDAPDTLYYVNDTQFNLRGTLNIIDGTPGTGPGFWIQTVPGVAGTLPTTPNISARQVLGVSNNGEDLGVVSFDVPQADAQAFYYTLTQISNVDLLSQTIPYATLNGMTVADFNTTYPNGIDNITNLDGLTMIFLEDTVSPTYNIYVATYVAGVIQLSVQVVVNLLEKFNISFGTTWAGTTWYKDATGVWVQQPLLTAVLNTLYYQDGVDPGIFGQINLIEQDNTSILYIAEILGKTKYTSPNGVVFTNGLQVTFRGNTYPASYENNSYFVEGVGTAIKLLPVSNYATPESYTLTSDIPYDSTPYDSTPFDGDVNRPTVPDYITINRASPDLNPWTRSNRWFHIDVIYASAAYNNTVATLNNNYRAKRPILEFVPGLRLFDFGTEGLPPISFIDFTETDALSNVNGKTIAFVDGNELLQNMTVVFAADNELDVRKQIYTVNYIDPNGLPSTPAGAFQIGLKYTITVLGTTDWNVAAGTTGITYNVNDTFTAAAVGSGTGVAQMIEPIIDLVPTSYSPVLYDQSTVTTGGELYSGISYVFDGLNWLETQQKTKVNQAPLFNVYDANGISLSNKVTYPSSTFTGSKLFSYLESTSAAIDPVLGFPLAYFYISSIGDIQFNNNFYTDTFLYVPKNIGVTMNVSEGFAYQYADRTTFEPQIGWKTAIAKSASRQQFKFTYDGNPLQLDIAVATSNVIPTVQLYINATFIQPQYYSVNVTTNNTTLITLTNTYTLGDVIEVLVLSDQVSTSAFYEVPVNLENNPLNGNSKTFTLGNIRNHYVTIGENLLTLQGPIIGANNSRDLGDIVPYGLQILQQSSPLTMAGYFMRSQDYDIFASLDYNSREYIKYKDKILNAVINFDYDIADLPVAQILDQAIANITVGRTKQSPFYWSDMLPTGSNYTSTVTTVTPITTSVFNTVQSYEFTSSNYLGLLVYVNNVLLTRGYDYTVATDSKHLTITVPLAVGDVVTINEYPDTAGNYCPNTPTKMGLYAKYKPEIYYDTTYVEPTFVIRGHDGSTTIAFDDIRDEVLLAFETRIYNNIKMDNNPVPLTDVEITRGFWNINDPSGSVQPYITNNYTLDEINAILGESFLSWVGWNKVDFTAQYYDPQDPFTYNYSQAGNKIDEQPLPGAWRGIYEMFYGTLQPNLTPWESLGFSEMPAWWVARYGPAPYTSGNLVLWDDLEAGYVADPVAPYYKPNYARPGLTQIIPSGTQGELLPPLQSVVGLYDPLAWRKSWVVGDDGPVEASWRASSSYPFAVMRLLAVTRPAEFFSLFADRDLYKYDDTLNQYLYNGRYRLNANTVQVYGDGVSKASYINWIVDYNRQIGVDSTTQLTDDLSNLDVRLAWRMGAFVDKSFMNIFLERSAPGSTNSTLQLSKDAYELILYKNQPFNQIDYSGLIIEIVEEGFAVYGYNNVQPFFNIFASNSAGSTRLVTSGGITVRIPDQYSQDIVQIPYGYVFTNATILVDFILSYGQYLESQGITFLDVENGYTLNWDQMAQEFLYFSAQGWGVNTIINLNPSARTLRAGQPYSVIDSISSLTPENMLLDQNRNALDTRDLIIQRYSNNAIITSSNNQTISYLRLKYTSYENIVVFQNVTSFGDLIYDPTTGLRQLRVGVQATVSANWDGTLDAQGFILNQANVKQWQSYKKYAKGEIVKYKNNYWTAQKIVQPKELFNYSDWYKSEYDRIEQGLLPNIATKADQLADSYNVHYQNLAQDQNLFAYGLIGFRPRQYMTDLNLDIVSQVNLYQQFIKTKGTVLSAELFTQANLKNESGQYDIYENWAVLVGTYGANANRSFYELQLNEALLQANPSTVQVVVPQQSSIANQTILLRDVYAESYKLTSTNILPTKYLSATETGLPSAGYVNLNDVDVTVFSLDDPSNIAADLGNIGIGTIIWVAKVNTYDWGIYQCGLVPPQITSLIDNLNGTSNLQFNDIHDLAVGDLIIIKYFDTAVNGVYRVLSVPTSTAVSIAYSFTNTNQTSISATGLAFYLQSMRVKQASDVASLTYVNNLTPGATAWVDDNGSGHWEVIRKQNPFTTGIALTSPQSISRMGNGVAQTYDKTLAFVGAPGTNSDAGVVYPFVRNDQTVYSAYSGIILNATNTVGFGTSVSAGFKTFIAVGAPQSDGGTGYVGIIYRTPVTNIFRISQLLLPPDGVYAGALFGSSVEMSPDENWLYVGAPGTNKVYAYGLVQIDPATVTYISDATTTVYNYSDSIQVTTPSTQVEVIIDGVPQTVGVDYTIDATDVTFATAPALNSTIVINRVNDITITSTGSATYSTSNLYSATTIESFNITVDGVIQRPIIDYSFSANTITFVVAPTVGAVIVVQTSSYYSYSSTITVSGIPNYAQFGASISTSTDGRTVTIGAPTDDSLVQTRAGVVYVFDRSVFNYEITNTAQTTYAIQGTVTSPVMAVYDGTRLTNTAQFLNGQYTVVGSDVVLASNVTLITGDILTIETNQFRLLQKITSTTDVNGQTLFGFASATCPTGCSLYIGSPDSSTTANAQSGSVERLVNQPKAYGIIASTVANPNLTGGSTLKVNGFIITVPLAPFNTVSEVANSINSAKIPNAIATVSADLVFRGDGTTQAFYIGAVYSSKSSYSTEVYLNGQYQLSGVQYSYNTTTEQIVFTTTPNPNDVILVVTGVLTISVLDSAAAIAGDKLTVLPGYDTSAFNQFGFQLFENTQVITSPLASDFAYFGSAIELDPTATHLVVGAPNGTAIEPVTFDNGTTYFDELSTTFFTPNVHSGIVYTYDYLPSSKDSVTDPGQFAFGQQIFDPISLSTNNGYGSSISYVGGVLLVGAPGNPVVLNPSFDGFVQIFTNLTNTPVWQIIHTQQPVVDIYEIDTVYSFNQITESTQTYYDFFDPLQGKIIGPAARNIDYTGGVDPANYNIGPIHNNGNEWGAEHVGEMWWDTANVRFIDPNQDDIAYASRRWATTFPGSKVEVYQWVESSVSPDVYTGTGTPLSVVSYTINSALDKNNVFVTRYYFWVRDIATIATGAGKTLSTTGVASYISNPRNSGLPFMAPLNSSTVALYNFAPYVSASDTILHIGFDKNLTESNIHQQYELVPDGRSDAFLDDQLYRKMLDSFCGADTSGQRVPDSLLPPALQYGVQFRPRQTMFVNRFLALKNYLGHANTILKDFPIAETRSFNLLNSSQPIPSAGSGEWNVEVASLEILGYQDIYAVALGYKYLVDSDSSQDGLWTIYTVIAGTVPGTRELQLTKVQNYYTPFYWSYIDWYQPGYNTAILPLATVPNRSSLETIPLTTVPVGSVARVVANPQGDWEIYERVNVDPKLGWSRVALQNGTIEFSNVLWDYVAGNFGFDGDVFDGQYFDQEPTVETRNIIRALNEEIYVDDLAIERNRSLMLVFNYIFSENTNPEWLQKTSLVDVDHQVRSLLPYQTYIQDNQTFVLDYINEVKPYHVQIRAFNLIYTGEDDYQGQMTDFDCPAYWDITKEIPQFVSPILLPYTHSNSTSPVGVNNSDTISTAAIWSDTPWDDWYNNYLLGIQAVTIINGGTGYTTTPIVTVTGTSTIAAVMEAIIDVAGQVVGINVLNPGAGYSTTATITITGGNGYGATAVANMGNERVRSVKTTIKYDRNQYVSTITDWTANVYYATGTKVRYANKVWVATQNNQYAQFDTAFWELVPAGELEGVERTQGYYVAGVNQPGLNLPILIDGLDYPGVQVYGLDFAAPGNTIPLDAVYESSYLDIYLGLRPTDINVDGGGYVDPRSAYNPEELVAGSTFDTLDFRVYSQSGEDPTGLNWGFPENSIQHVYSPVSPTYSFANVLQNPVEILVYNQSAGTQLYENVNYTVDWNSKTITINTLNSGLASGDTIDIAVYGLGGGNQLYQNSYTGAQALAGISIPVVDTFITEMAIFANGVVVPTGNITVAPNTPTTSTVTVDAGAVLPGDYIALAALGDTKLLDNSVVQLSWSTPQAETFLGTGLATPYPLTTSTLTYTNPVALVVTVDGKRYRTPGTSGYSGDGVTTAFALPTRLNITLASVLASEVIVYANGVQLTNLVDYSLSAGNTDVVFATAPATNVQILIAVTTGADCYVSGTNLIFNSFVPVLNANIEVITWNDTRQQHIVPQVFVGAVLEDVTFTGDITAGSAVITNVSSFDSVQVGLIISNAAGNLDSDSVVASFDTVAKTITLDQVATGTAVGTTCVVNNIYEGFGTTAYDQGNVTGLPGSYDWSTGVPIYSNEIFLSYPVINPERLMVSLNGKIIFPGDGFEVVNGNQIILPNLLGPTDVLMVTQFTDSVVTAPAAYRIFQDMRGIQTVHVMTAETTTTLAAPLSATEIGNISVVNASALSAPDFANNVWGVLTINGERIMYRDIDYVANTVSSLLRGTAGTGATDHPIAPETTTFTADGTTNSFTWTLPASYSAPSVNTLVVSINGTITVDYTTTLAPNAITVIFQNTPATGDLVDMEIPLVDGSTIVYNMSRSTLASLNDQNYISNSSELGDGVQTVYVATGVTVDSGLEAAVEVYVGGLRQSTGYTVTGIAPVSVTFTVAPPAGADVTILVRHAYWWTSPTLA